MRGRRETPAGMQTETLVMLRRFYLLVLIAFSLVLLAWRAPVCAQTDPLPSWNEGATKQSITNFVAQKKAGAVDQSRGN